jgi:multiple sugar transport system permease protein
MREPRWLKIVRVVVLGTLASCTLIPIYAMVTSAIKPLRDVQGPFEWIPSHVTFRPFIDIWHTVPLGHYFINSIIVAGSAMVCSVAVAIFAAYGVSRYRFKGRRTFTITVLSTQMFPGILFLLPLFLIYVNIGKLTGIPLYDSRTGLIITYMTFSLPFAIWMLVGYFDTIPRGLDESAQVDGAGPLRTLLQVILPTALPGVVAVAVYAFMTAWGEVLFASVMTNDSSRTLAVGLQSYATEQDVYWNQVMAASLVVSIPVVVGFLALQRHFVAGLTAGAVK